MPDYDSIDERQVVERTGRGWDEWFRVLTVFDREHEERRDYHERARHLREEYRLDPWWARAVAVRYGREHEHERERG